MQQTYKLGTVTTVLSETNLESDGAFFIQTLEVTTDEGKAFEVTLGTEYEPVSLEQKKTVGERVVVVTQQNQLGLVEANIADSYRLPAISWLLLLFAIVVVAVGRLKGLLSLVGMVVSFVIIASFVIPSILSGHNPLLVSLLGALGIGVSTIYLSHGFTRQSHIALFSIMASLAVVAILASLSVSAANLLGLGSEEAYFLQFSQEKAINLRGLLLGGIMLGALGVLDDVAVSQVSVVFQLRSVKESISFSELYNRSLTVGKDHVASLVNTLVLAYAGANLPLFLLFTLNTETPAWVTLNSEIIIEEVIRTLTGSIGLVLAVPLTTAIAAIVALRMSKTELRESSAIGHHH